MVQNKTWHFFRTSFLHEVFLHSPSRCPPQAEASLWTLLWQDLVQSFFAVLSPRGWDLPETNGNVCQLCHSVLSDFCLLGFVFTTHPGTRALHRLLVSLEIGNLEHERYRCKFIELCKAVTEWHSEDGRRQPTDGCLLGRFRNVVSG